MLSRKLIKSMIYGSLATIVGEFITKILVALHFGENAMYELNSLVVTINRPSFLMGLIMNIIAGGLVAILLCLLFEKLGPVYQVTWSVVGSIMAWLVYELFFLAYIEGKTIPIRSFNDYYVHIIGTVAFGITLGLLFKYVISSKEKA